MKLIFCLFYSFRIVEHLFSFSCLNEFFSSTESSRDAEEGLGCRGVAFQRAAVRPVHVRHPAQRRAVLRPGPAPSRRNGSSGPAGEPTAGCKEEVQLQRLWMEAEQDSIQTLTQQFFIVCLIFKGFQCLCVCYGYGQVLTELQEDSSRFWFCFSKATDETQRVKRIGGMTPHPIE